MKRFITAAIMAFFLFTGAASAQMADTFKKKQKLQWIKDATNLAAELGKIRNKADNLRKRYYAITPDSPLIVTHTTYTDDAYTDQSSCETATGTWTDGACVLSITDEASCEETDGYFWNGSACQSMPVTIGSDYQLLSPIDISNLIGSFDDFVDDWMDGTATPQSGNGTNIWKAIRSE